MKTQSTIIVFLAAMAVIASSCSSLDYDGFSGSYVTDAYTPGEGDRFEEFKDNDFIATADQRVSTFSVDADGAAYAYMRKVVGRRVLPDKSSVRIEEYLNYFTFDYPDPEAGKDVAINAEVGACPWNAEHYLMRLGIKGRSLSSGRIPQSNYVFLIDVSGSMSSDDKLPLLKKGLVALLEGLDPKDRISIVTYSGKEKKLLESTPVSEASKIKKAIDKLNASGATAGAAGLKMACEECLANYIEGGNNRVIMGTDGDFNVGVTSTDALMEMVQGYASKGIYLTVCGFGSGNLNDAMMEKVSNWGNGTYQFIDSEKELTKVFVEERGKLFAVASDAKNQVTFDPAVVESYRLIGYENRVLSEDDFTNDEKDAGEIGAGQTITALYELVPAEGFEAGKTVAKFDFRYKKSLNDASIPLSMDVVASNPDGSSSNLSFAAAVASFGMLLRHSEYAGSSSFEMASALVSESLGSYGSGLDDYQTALRDEFRKLIEKAATIGK